MLMFYQRNKVFYVDVKKTFWNGTAAEAASLFKPDRRDPACSIWIVPGTEEETGMEFEG